MLSIGLALLIDPTWAVYSWALMFVAGRIVDWAFPLGSVLPDTDD
ncbi:MAG: hypothetical protein ABJB47_19790 [Actinomycetota bacterium]